MTRENTPLSLLSKLHPCLPQPRKPLYRINGIIAFNITALLLFLALLFCEKQVKISKSLLNFALTCSIVLIR